MNHFAFGFGLNQTEGKRLESVCRTVWGGVQTRTVEDFSLYLPSSTNALLLETPHGLGALCGYVALSALSNGSSKNHEESFIDAIVDRREWPLTGDWSGSFCAVAYSKSDRNLILLNDPIGYLPLYYSPSSSSVCGSTSLITLGRFRGGSIDLTGLCQRLSNELCNYGRRTLLKNVNRLLPGEFLRFTSPSSTGKSVFDNTLYGGIVDGDLDEAASVVWDAFKDEVARVVANKKQVSLALSGGWDSRLILGAIRNGSHSTHCYTYGDCDSYESRIARRCATIAGAEYKCLSLVGNYIRHRNDIEPFVLASENTGYHFFFPFFEQIDPPPDRRLLLLGDQLESIDGRNLGEHASRTGRKKSFLRGLIGLQEELEETTPQASEIWRQKITQERLTSSIRSLSLILPGLLSENSHDQVIEETSEDLDVTFQRVLSHKIPFLPGVHELFQWFQYVRYRPASQLLFLNAGWNSVCPPMSMRFVRLISKIHPLLRLRRRLMRAIMRIPELRDLGSIPSAQIPWVGSKAPGFVKDLIWGFRSGTDQMLIKRAVRTKNHAMRRRVIKTFDLVAEYRRPNAIDHVASWFSGRWMKADKIVQIAKKRAELASWPLVTIDIGSLANVSMILDLSFPE